jgi:DNA invertase Pin-like site-specific DNA recombinase
MNNVFTKGFDMTKKAIIYRRASTSETKQMNSLDNQARELYGFAVMNGYEIIEDIAEYQSASNGSEREGFKKALSLLKADDELTLICYDLTRLSRDLGNWTSFNSFLPRIRFATRGDVAITELEASILLVVSANESRTMGSRISHGIQRAKERALEAGVEWKWGGNDNPVAATAANVAKTSAWRSSIIEICSALDTQGLKTYREKCEWLNFNGFRSQRGNPISIATLRNALISQS